MKHRSILVFFVLLALSATALGRRSKQCCKGQAELVCDLRPTAGNKVRGRVTFKAVHMRRRCGVRVRARVEGLRPSQEHGWHIHMYGDISLPDGTAQGGHFTSPSMDKRPHGLPEDILRHWGDLGNLKADFKGVARPNQIDSVIS
eukprot:IDg3049t1